MQQQPALGGSTGAECGVSVAAPGTHDAAVPVDLDV